MPLLAPRTDLDLVDNSVGGEDAPCIALGRLPLDFGSNEPKQAYRRSLHVDANLTDIHERVPLQYDPYCLCNHLRPVIFRWFDGNPVHDIANAGDPPGHHAGKAL